MNAPAQTVFTHTLGKPRRRMDRHAPWKGRNRSAPRMAPAFCTPPAKRLFGNMKGGARVLDQDLMKKGSRLFLLACININNSSRPRPDEKGIKT